MNEKKSKKEKNKEREREKQKKKKMSEKNVCNKTRSTKNQIEMSLGEF